MIDHTFDIDVRCQTDISIFFFAAARRAVCLLPHENDDEHGAPEFPSQLDDDWFSMLFVFLRHV